MKDGEHIEYYESGEIRYKYNYLGGKLNGENIYYYESGKIYSKCFYIDGDLNCEYISYFKDGELWSKRYFINNIHVTKLEWISYNRNIKLELLGL